MAKYKVTKCVDSFTHYEAIVEADSPEEAVIQAMENNDVYNWEHAGVTEYDSVDYRNIEPELIQEISE